jgi:hypothetical protein
LDSQVVTSRDLRSFNNSPLPAAGPHAQLAPAPPPARAQTPLRYESDPLYQRAQGLFRSDIRKAMELLESVLYERILREKPDYENNPEIRKKLASLR